MRQRRFLFSRVCAISAVLVAITAGRVVAQQAPKPTPNRGLSQSVRIQDAILSRYEDIVLSANDAQALQSSRFGVVLEPTSEAMQLQLNLPPKKCLLVRHVIDGSPAAKVGVKRHDVLLTINGDILSNVVQFTQQVTQPKKKIVVLKVLRGGQQITLNYTPPADAAGAGENGVGEDAVLKHADAALHLAINYGVIGNPSAYRIGISMGQVSETLRAQLDLPTDQGVVVIQVLEKSAAAEAGLEQHDIILKLNEKPIGNLKAMSKAVEEAKETPLAVTLLRKGHKMTIEVTPRKTPPQQVLGYRAQPLIAHIETIEIPTFDKRRALKLGPAHLGASKTYSLEISYASQNKPGSRGDLQRQLGKVAKQLATLQQTIQQLQQTAAAADSASVSDEKEAAKKAATEEQSKEGDK